VQQGDSVTGNTVGLRSGKGRARLDGFLDLRLGESRKRIQLKIRDTLNTLLKCSLQYGYLLVIDLWRQK